MFRPARKKVDKCSDVGRSADECADYYVEIKKCDDPDLPYEETCSGFPRECESCAGGSPYAGRVLHLSGDPGGGQPPLLREERPGDHLPLLLACRLRDPS